MTFHRTRYVVLLSIVALCLGCQPDLRPGDWRADVGTDTTSDSEPSLIWDGPWERIPSPRGGAVFEKVAGQLFLWAHSGGGWALAAYSTDGTDWTPASESAIAANLEFPGEASHVKIDGDRYLIVTHQREEERLQRIYRFGDDTDDWRPVADLAGLSNANTAQTVAGRALATTANGIHLRGEDGTWKDITPSADLENGLDLKVAGSLLIARSTNHSKPRVSTDLGETWSEAKTSEGLWIGPWIVESVGGTYYSFGAPHVHGANPSPEIVQSLLTSSDGTSWKPSSLETTYGLEKHSLTELDGELYALDASSRLVRISPSTLETTVVTDPDRTLRGRYSLWRIDDTLVASSSASRRGSVLTWQPGDTRWSLADSVGVDPFEISVHDGKLMANAIEYQVYEPDAERWSLSEPIEPWSLNQTSDGRVAFDVTEGCVYVREADGWQPRLQWSGSGIERSCDPNRASVSLTDIVAHDGDYIIGSVEPAGDTSLVRWSPESGDIKSLLPDDLKGDSAPGVERLLTVENELWVYLRGSPHPHDWVDGLFRLQNGGWETFQAETIGQENIVRADFQTYGDELIAKIQCYISQDESETSCFAHLRPSENSFQWIDLPDGVSPPTTHAEHRGFYTEIGPMLLADDRLWRYDVQSETWDTIGQPVREGSIHPRQIVALGRALYVETPTGDIYVTRASRAE